MEIVEKERDLPLFDTDTLNTFSFFFLFFLPAAEITAQFTGKIAAEGLNGL